MPAKSFKEHMNPVFVESGSFLGDGIQLAIDAGFSEIYSIELSHDLHQICKNRFKNNSNVHLIEGDVELVLEGVIAPINQKITFWLDGHDSGGITACGLHGDPLIQEMDIIEKHHIKEHTIIIDDERGNFVNMEFHKERILKINPKYTFYVEDGLCHKDDILIAKIV